jgi:hypothetical protein
LTDDSTPTLWTPAPRILGASIGDVVKAYSLLLEIRYPDHHKAFQLRTASNPAAANAEAAVFSWLRWQGLSPTPSDAPGVGGPDYLCSPMLSKAFLIEVTSLNPEAVSVRSGWPDGLSERAHAFAMITPNLWSKAKAKASQLGGHEVARVLAICLTHMGSGALLGTLAAEWLMTSQPKLSVPVGAPVTAVREVTDLGKSAFLAIRDGSITPVRQSISAVLLIAIWEHELHVVGMLHPDPAVPFDYRNLRELPFLRLDWPVKDGVLTTEWVVAKPAPRVDPNIPLSPTDEELRGA